jgi:hypothetical protein
MAFFVLFRLAKEMSRLGLEPHFLALKRPSLRWNSTTNSNIFQHTTVKFGSKAVASEAEFTSEPPGARTQHNLIKSQVLYQLS